jgi:hypothetical protein
MHYDIRTLKLGWSSLWLFLAKFVSVICWYWTSTKWTDARLIGFATPMHIPGLNLYIRPTLVPTYLACLFIYLPTYIPSYLGFQPTYLFAFAFLDYLPSYVGPQVTYLLTGLPRLPNFLPWPRTYQLRDPFTLAT